MAVAVRVTASLLRSIIRAELPRGWRITYTSDDRRWGCNGRPHRELVLPRLKRGYLAMWVFFHELSHAQRMRTGKFKPNPGMVSSSYEEWIAENFAIAKLTEYGFPILRDHTEDARRNVRKWIRREERRGIPIYEGVRRWAYPNKRRVT